MKILHLYTQAGGVNQWRFKTPARALVDAGHEVIDFWGDNHAFADMGKTDSEVLATLCKLIEKVDIVHCGYSSILQHTELLVQAREHSIRIGRNIPFIVDIDDDILSVPPYNLGYKAFHPGAPGKKVVLLQLHVADGVSVSTKPLIDVLTSHARAIYHLPNLDDSSLWQNLPTDPTRSDDQSVRLFFAGGQGRYGDLDVIREPIEWALAHYDGKTHSGSRRPKARFFTAACTPDWAAPFMQNDYDPTKNDAFHIWHAEPKTYRAILSWVAPDIFINPVQANTFNASKSCIKAYEASRVGSAYIGTDWPAHDPLPTGTCLKVDNTPTQWKESLGQLIEDKELRQRLAVGLKAHVLKNAQIEDHIDLWENTYTETIKLGPIKDLSQIVNPKK